MQREMRGNREKAVHNDGQKSWSKNLVDRSDPGDFRLRHFLWLKHA
jgi:hypothetical protein